MSRGLAVSDLHLALAKAPAICIRFSRKDQLERYRRELYDHNSKLAKVTGRYRTMREGLRLTIIRIGA